jgi:diacylglycerol kinase
MDFVHPDFTIQGGSVSSQNIRAGLRKVFISDPGLTLQLFMAIPLVAGGIIFHMNAAQWTFTLLVTLLFIVAGVFRRAALLQISHDTKCSPFHVSRIKSMGNAIVAITGGISLLTYLLIFVPMVVQLLET